MEMSMAEAAQLIGMRDITIFALEKQNAELQARVAELEAQVTEGPEPNVPCVSERPIRLDRRRAARDEEPPGA